MSNPNSLRTTKGNATRRARKDFLAEYPMSGAIAIILMKHPGFSCRDIAAATDGVFSARTIATIKGNLNRKNKFSLMAKACNW